MSLFQSFRRSSGVPVTPSPSQKRARTTRSTSLEEVKLQLDHNSISPSKRTTEWLKAHSAATKTPKALSVKGSKVSKHPNLSRQDAKEKTKFWSWILPTFLYGQSEESHHEKSCVPDDQDDSDGSTFVEEHPLSPSPAPEGDTTLAIQDDGVNVEEDILPAIRPEEDNDHFTPSPEDLRHMQHWSKDQIWLFNKLNMRGFEPLLHETWTQDFLTLPDELFSETDSEVFIKAYRGNEYNAAKALRSLFDLGGRVRGQIACNLRPEETIYNALASYHKWSHADGGLAHTTHLPNLTIGVAAKHESVLSIVGRVTDYLHQLGRSYRAYFLRVDKEGKKYYSREPPTVYGIVIIQSVVTFLTYDSRKKSNEVINMAKFNFNKENQDVWNALAVSILFIRARNYLIRMKDADEWVDALPEEDDTDA